MGTTQIIFWGLAAISVVAALGVITCRKPVKSALSLLIVFFTLSGQYILMNAQVIAMVNLMVSAGAVMVIFLFVIILINPQLLAEPMKNRYMKLIGVIASLTLMIVLIGALAHTEQSNVIVRPGMAVGLAENLGKTLIDKYAVPFVMSSLLFLSAIMGIVIINKSELSKTNMK